MRILIISNIKGGVSRFTDELIKGLRKSKIQADRVNIFTSHQPYSLNPQVISKISSTNYDLIHTNFASPLLTWKIVKYKKPPCLLTIHGYPNPKVEENWIYKILYKIEDFALTTNAKKVEKCVTVSHSTARELRSHYNIQTSVIYPGIDYEKYKFKKEWRIKLREKLKINDDELTFLFVGRLHRAKDPATLFKAMKKYLEAGKKAKLLIIGTGKRIRVDYEKNMQKNILFSGEVPFNEIAKYYSAADALIIPSIIESFGYAAVEAMSTPIPIIASTVCSEIVGDGGIFFNPGNVEDLYQKLLLLAENQHLRRELAAKGLMRVKRLFSAERMIKDYVITYETLVKK